MIVLHEPANNSVHLLLCVAIVASSTVTVGIIYILILIRCRPDFRVAIVTFATRSKMLLNLTRMADK